MPNENTDNGGAEGATESNKDDSKNQTSNQDDLKGLLAKRDELLKETKTLKAKLEKIESDRADADKKRLAEEGKYKELLEVERKEKELLKTSLINQRKEVALERAAIKAGFNAKFIKLLDDAEFDDDGNLKNADQYFASKKTELPEAFGVTGSAGKFNNNSPTKTFSSNAQSVAAFKQELNDMSPEDYAKNREAIRARAKEFGLKI